MLMGGDGTCRDKDSDYGGVGIIINNMFFS